jgi:transketolase
VIAAGVTLEQALKAAEDLETFSGLSVRVLDPFTIKPLDEEAVVKNALEAGGRIVTVEDHYPEVVKHCLFVL